MPLNVDVNFEFNMLSSVEAFLNTYVVTPYNAAVATTNFHTPLAIIMDNPDDPATVATTPVITLYMGTDYKTDVESTGLSDNLVWTFKQFNMRCYAALSNDNGVFKPSITASSYLRSLMTNISSALTLPLSDYTQPSVPLQDVAYITGGRIINLKGSVTMLAIDKHRFDYEFRIRFPIVALNG